MANISWYGGASIRDQRWPFNSADSPAQPFVSGDFGKNPTGYGPVLERYFLGSTGICLISHFSQFPMALITASTYPSPHLQGC